MLIFLKLVIAHLITDFFLQPKSWIDSKRKHTWKSKFLYVHIFLTGAIAWLVLWDWKAWSIVLFITVTHYVIDVGKLAFGKDNLPSFLLDQILHFAVLAVAAIYYTSELNELTNFFNEYLHSDNLTILAGYLLIIRPTGFLVGKATRKWQMELTDDKSRLDSLQDAGIWIGIMERILVLTFVVFDHFSSIGFLIAAKSILRFSDKNETNPRKQTEYVLIGTLLSFSIAILTGLVIKWLIAM